MADFQFQGRFCVILNQYQINLKGTENEDAS